MYHPFILISNLEDCQRFQCSCFQQHLLALHYDSDINSVDFDDYGVDDIYFATKQVLDEKNRNLTDFSYVTFIDYGVDDIFYTKHQVPDERNHDLTDFNSVRFDDYGVNTTHFSIDFNNHVVDDNYFAKKQVHDERKHDLSKKTVRNLASLNPDIATTEDDDDDPERNLTSSVYCKLDSNEQLLVALNSFLYNPSSIPGFSSKGLRGDSKNFCKNFCKLQEQMKNIKQLMSEEMKQKQRNFQQQFKNIERCKQKNWKMQSSYGKSVLSFLGSKLYQINKNNKLTKKKIFSRSFKHATVCWKNIHMLKNYLP